MTTDYGHQWSGWPGAFCLKCGAEDKTELAVGDGIIDPLYMDIVPADLPIEYRQEPCPWKDYDYHGEEWKKLRRKDA